MDSVKDIAAIFALLIAMILVITFMVYGGYLLFALLLVEVFKC